MTIPDSCNVTGQVTLDCVAPAVAICAFVVCRRRKTEDQRDGDARKKACAHCRPGPSRLRVLCSARSVRIPRRFRRSVGKMGNQPVACPGGVPSSAALQLA